MGFKERQCLVTEHIYLKDRTTSRGSPRARSVLPTGSIGSSLVYSAGPLNQLPPVRSSYTSHNITSMVLRALSEKLLIKSEA